MSKQRVWPNILFLGDSLTQFGYSVEGSWVSILSDVLQAKCDVINRGLSGYNTKTYRYFLPDIVTPDIVKRNVATFVLLGANDSVMPIMDQHVCLEDYKVGCLS